MVAMGSEPPDIRQRPRNQNILGSHSLLRSPLSCTPSQGSRGYRSRTNDEVVLPDEAVAQPVNGQDVLGMGGVGLDLLAQRCDVDVNGSSRWHRIVAPDLVEQLVARQQRVPMLHEIPQKLVLEGREGQRLAGPEHSRAAKVYSDIAESESLSGAPRVRAAAP